MKLLGMVSPLYVRLESPYDVLAVCDMLWIVSIMLTISGIVLPRLCKANLGAECTIWSKKTLQNKYKRCHRYHWKSKTSMRLIPWATALRCGLIYCSGEIWSLSMAGIISYLPICLLVWFALESSKTMLRRSFTSHELKYFGNMTLVPVRCCLIKYFDGYMISDFWWKIHPSKGCCAIAL